MQIIGHFASRVINILKLNIAVGTPIYIGVSNLMHMQANHLADYNKYSDKLGLILSSPDYVCINKKDGSVEYVKEFPPDNVKVAVRISTNGNYYARTLYVLNNKRTLSFIKRGILKKV